VIRPTRCEVDLAAIEHNVSELQRRAGDAALCAVVKANAYGHGAVRIARAALDAGASWLGVALLSEGIELREAGIEAPMLLLSEPPPAMIGSAIEFGLTPSLYSELGIAAAISAAKTLGHPVAVHLCVDTGMRRVGLEPAHVGAALEVVDSSEALTLSGVWTHFAVADEPDNPFTVVQRERFDKVVADHGLDREGLLLHLANSAAVVDHPEYAAGMVRCGIAMYGVAPAPSLAGRVDLRPALSLRSEVSFVKRVGEGEGVSYGHRWRAPSDRFVATVPIGYADGVRRDLGLRGGRVLIGGERRPIVGAVTMDQLLVDLGDDGSVAAGDEVVLIGEQGGDAISANEVAGLLDTIGYEVLCAISARVPRTY